MSRVKRGGGDWKKGTNKGLERNVHVVCRVFLFLFFSLFLFHLSFLLMCLFVAYGRSRWARRRVEETN